MFEAVLELSMQLGETYNRVHRRSAARRQDFVFEALTRLHARALLTASEVLALLRTGHASGANARWRTMHEISVVAQFLSKHGGPTAERYLLFDVVAREKLHAITRNSRCASEREPCQAHIAASAHNALATRTALRKAVLRWRAGMGGC